MLNMDWTVFCKDTLTGDVVSGCLGEGRDITYLNWIFSAWGWTVSVSLTALFIALVTGSVIGVIRTLPDSPWLVRFGNAWVELFRNIPLLVQIFLWYFVVPALVPPMKDFPPFVLVVDVGTVIEVYAEFSKTGGTYTPYPDPRSHRLQLADLARPEVQDRLRRIWTDPDSLNPARISAQVTRDVAALLAQLAKSLESGGSGANFKPNQAPALTSQAPVAPETVAAYLTRCLFSMFAEDVELLPKGAFLGLLQTHRDDPATLQQMLRILWADMDRGGFSAALAVMSEIGHQRPSIKRRQLSNM